MELEVEKVLHMTGGEGEFSYASNSSLQKTVISKAKPAIQESIKALIYGNNFRAECFNFSDLGCSSGPNAYMPALEVIEALHSTCRSLNHKPPMLQVFLNDLPGNDFNSTFKLLPSFYERLKKQKGDEFGQCVVAAVPGSFYGRLFPPHSLDFIFSSYSLHWLSQDKSGDQLNKGNVYIGSTSPSYVHKAYLSQFESDFTMFLGLRAKELKLGGRMVLTFIAHHKNHNGIWEVIGMVINDMVSEGLIEESKLDSFNMPAYAPYPEEVRSVIQREGSFNIHQLETFKINQADCMIDQNKVSKNIQLDQNYYDYQRGKISAKHIRSVGQSLLADHFGNSIIDEMFERFSIKVTQHLDIAFGESTNLLITLVKK